MLAIHGEPSFFGEPFREVSARAVQKAERNTSYLRMKYFVLRTSIRHTRRMEIWTFGDTSSQATDIVYTAHQDDQDRRPEIYVPVE